MRAFNLSLDNVATLILSATRCRAKPEQYLTLVARVNLEDEAQRTFFQVTDRDRFDIAPRLTLVDAVDVDGDGRGRIVVPRADRPGQWLGDLSRDRRFDDQAVRRRALTSSLSVWL